MSGENVTGGQTEQTEEKRPKTFHEQKLKLQSNEIIMLLTFSEQIRTVMNQTHLPIDHKWL